ncbi:sugar phosphate isomerase/epimerase [Microbulbifer sp. Q7]|uniref:sugar phosphate isomerase/epimerase family protein n=1 Tax=Microbulbifer sp. Q7 TaxID=1785091 RepID=UPI000836E2BE|nr:sugar phosphate isomerase/epimerase [Microbulbifer sp. Q7]
MKLAFLCPLWGSEHLPFETFLRKARDAGYDGVEVAFPNDRGQCREMVAQLEESELLYVAQHWDTFTTDFDAHQRQFYGRLEQLAETQPLFINSHTGRDHFIISQNLALLSGADKLSAELGLPIYHETHRGRFNFACHVTAEYLALKPDLKLTADFSHWCCVAESLLQDQEEAMQKAIEHSFHVHCRVGHIQGSQVIDPALPVYAETLARHLQWWRAIAEAAQARGQALLTLTAEFGPAPYMLPHPDRDGPIADQWAHNCWIMERVRRELQSFDTAAAPYANAQA